MADIGPTARRSPTSATHPELVTRQLLVYAQDLRRALATSRRAASELSRTHVETVAALAAAVDARDVVTGGHVLRVASYGTILARALAPEMVDDPQLVYGFLLHDIGKIAIPDAILNKPGRLDDDERATMRGHVEAGVRFVKSVSFLRPALNLIATHHEHFDGSGYPRGLAGAEIPLSARMFIVCDAYDAMTHDRPYRRGMSPERALAELARHRGAQFDPDVIDAFTGCMGEILSVPERPELPRVRHAAAPVAPHRDALGASAIFDAIDHAICLLSPEGTVVDANARFLSLLQLATVPVGMTISEVARRARAVFSDPEAARRTFLRLEHDLLTGRRQGELLTHVGRILWTSNVLHGDEGTVTGRVVTLSSDGPGGPDLAAPPARRTRGTDAAADVRVRPDAAEDDADEVAVLRAELDEARDTVRRVTSLLENLLEDAGRAVSEGDLPR